MNGVIDGYFGDPRELRHQADLIRRVGQDVGLHAALVRRTGDAAADATGETELSAAVRSATSHLASAVDSTSGAFEDIWHYGHTQAVGLLRAFGEEDA